MLLMKYGCEMCHTSVSKYTQGETLQAVEENTWLKRLDYVKMEL